MNTAVRFASLLGSLLLVVVLVSSACDSDSGPSGKDIGQTDVGVEDSAGDITQPDQTDLTGQEEAKDETGSGSDVPEEVVPTEVVDDVEIVADLIVTECDDGICEAGETCDNCPEDCGCTQCGESCQGGVCTFTACQDRQCGDDGCGGECGVCPDWSVCIVASGTCGPSCNPDTMEFVGEVVQRINFLNISRTGHPGDGLNVDADPETCSPAITGCSGGVDNAVGRLVDAYSVDANVPGLFALAIQDGHATRLIEAHGWNHTGAPFSLHFLLGKSEQSLCDLSVDRCTFSVLPESFHAESCLPKTIVASAQLNGNVLTAGGADQQFTLLVDPGYIVGVWDDEGPKKSGIQIPITMYRTHLNAQVQGVGSEMTWSGGILSGAIPLASLMEVVDNLPAELDLPVPASMIKTTINMSITPDIDLDGDGVKESFSIGIQFGTVSAHIVGSDLPCIGKQCGDDGYGNSCGVCTGDTLCSLTGQCVNPQLVWVSIPGGSYSMGCSTGDVDCWARENPAHNVTISPFHMTETEITEAQYTSVMGTNPSCNHGGAGGVAKPVECVRWSEAKQFCEMVGGRLPTEAEWEMAARGGTTTKYYCGNDTACLGEIAWYHPGAGERKQNVKGKTPNAFGLYDMLGNVMEWTADWYSGDYYSQSPADNPQGPSSGTQRVHRGGSFGNPEKTQRVSFRNGWNPDLAEFYIGIRCVRAIP
jgi:hypothetical protein